MNGLVKYLVENSIGKSVGIMAGSFKPPTKGHFLVVQEALKKLPEIDEFIIFIGSETRDNITQEQSHQIWEIYKKYLSPKLTIELSKITPVRDVYDYAKGNRGINITWVIGIREGQEEDKLDYKKRTGSVEKYSNLKTLVINTDDDTSGTKTREAIKLGRDEFEKNIPTIISKEDRNIIWEIVSGKIEEIKINNEYNIIDNFY